MRRVCLVLALLALVACGDKPLRAVDGGMFTLPDAGFYDGGTRDSGTQDAGPFVCAPACERGEACGCINEQCGCRAPGAHGAACDPQHPETCSDPTMCVRARREGRDIYLCSDGRLGTSCSKTADVCTTALGCVCYTESSGATDCKCLDAHNPNNELCDRMVPETCPDGVCVRTTNTADRAFFICSDGAEGRPCEPGDNSCQTSIGCTCPIVFGRARCLCSEPSGEGGPCDPNIADSCTPPLMCYPTQRPNEGITTTCSDSPPTGGRDGGALPGCTPGDPMSCPPGFICLQTAQGFQCVAQ